MLYVYGVKLQCKLRATLLIKHDKCVWLADWVMVVVVVVVVEGHHDDLELTQARMREAEGNAGGCDCNIISEGSEWLVNFLCAFTFYKTDEYS